MFNLFEQTNIFSIYYGNIGTLVFLYYLWTVCLIVVYSFVSTSKIFYRIVMFNLFEHHNFKIISKTKRNLGSHSGNLVSRCTVACLPMHASVRYNNPSRWLTHRALKRDDRFNEARRQATSKRQHKHTRTYRRQQPREQTTNTPKASSIFLSSYFIITLSDERFTASVDQNRNMASRDLSQRFSCCFSMRELVDFVVAADVATAYRPCKGQEWTVWVFIFGKCLIRMFWVVGNLFLIRLI